MSCKIFCQRWCIMIRGGRWIRSGQGEKNMCMCKCKCNCNLGGMSCVGVVGLSGSSPTFSFFQKLLYSMWSRATSLTSHHSLHLHLFQLFSAFWLFVEWVWVVVLSSNPMGAEGGRIYHILLPPQKKRGEKKRKMLEFGVLRSVGMMLLAPSPCASPIYFLHMLLPLF